MKKIFLLIFFIVALVNSSFYLKTAESANPSIKEVSRTKEDQATNKNWNWEFEITTESIVDNEKMVVDIYKLKDGKSSRISSKQYVIKNNYLVYSTDYILEDKTEYMIFFSIANTNPIVTKQFTSKTGSADPGNTTNIPINVDPAKGAGDEGNDNTYTLLAPIGEFTTAPDNFGDYLNIIFKIAIGLCAALAVIMIVLGGISYMGNESIFGKTEAKSKISAAILGLIIALGAYALLNTIDPNLLGKQGVTIKQVSAEIIDLPDAGDGTVDPDFSKGSGGSYSTDASVSSGVTNVVNKLKQGWEINQFRVYTNNRMLISIKKGSEVDNSNIIDIRPGINGYAPAGTAKTGDRKTPVGSWKILSIKTSKNGQPVYNKTGANMGATFWLLSPMTNGERGIGMHGNKNGTLSGTYGCIRLKNADLLALLPYVKPGIVVNVGN